MKKKIMLLLSALCLTVLLSSCTKTVSEKELEGANFTDEILAIESVNTFEEMITDDYEPKFEITNTYEEGDIPYFNFDFEEKESVNNLMKAYALAVHASDLVLENGDKECWAYWSYKANAEINKISTTNGDFIFVNFALIKDEEEHQNDSNFIEDTNFIAIDMTNKKLLTNKEIIDTFNIDMNSALNEIISEVEKYNDPDIEMNNYLKNEYEKFENNEIIYCGGKIVNETKMTEFGKIIDDYELELEYYGYGTLFRNYLFDNYQTSKRSFKYNNETNQIELYEDYYQAKYIPVTDKLN